MLLDGCLTLLRAHAWQRLAIPQNITEVLKGTPPIAPVRIAASKHPPLHTQVSRPRLSSEVAQKHTRMQHVGSIPSVCTKQKPLGPNTENANDVWRQSDAPVRMRVPANRTSSPLKCLKSPKRQTMLYRFLSATPSCLPGCTGALSLEQTT